MFRKTITASLSGIDSYKTCVEVDIGRGIPAFNIVGYADSVVKESVERIKSAMVNSGYDFPRNRIIVNLTPADRRKRGSHYDLAIATALIGASSYIGERHLKEYAIFGELTLEGKVSPVAGILPLVICCLEEGVDKIIVPWENREEASLIDNVKIYPVKTLEETIEIITGKREAEEYKDKVDLECIESNLDFNQVYGQENVKRAMVIAAAGGHSMVIMGPPGVGKTMMAKRFPYILPPLDDEEILEVTKVYSIAGLLRKKQKMIKERPFRKPVNTITKSAMLGGGTIPKPGEISLAHKGVLFIDEFTTFDRKLLESLRKPLEDKEIYLIRNRESTIYPADCITILATNPCPCGYLGDDRHMCHCSPGQLSSFREKFSGPLMDRIDIHVQMENIEYENIENRVKGMDTKSMKELVANARDIQKARYMKEGITLNSQLNEEKMDIYCLLGKEEKDLLRQAYDAIGLSLRAYNKVIKLSRTIADLEGSEHIKAMHIAEALQYREIVFHGDAR